MWSDCDKRSRFAVLPDAKVLYLVELTDEVMGEDPKVVDLFCGAGGFSLGFEQAGFNIVAAVDRNKSALKTYSYNFEDEKDPENCERTFPLDIRNFSTEDLEEGTEYVSEDIDVVIGGPPCKGFSTAGRMDPDDPRNELVVEYAKTVRELDPEVVILENVTGILGMEDGKYVTDLRETLSAGADGYTVSEPVILTAADYGVPQLRERVVITATKGSGIELPSPTHYPEDGQEKMDTNHAMNSYVTVEDAIGDLSFLQYGEEASEYKLWARTDYQQEMRLGSEEIHNHVAPNHGETVRERYKQFNPGDTIDDVGKDYQTKKHSMMRWNPDEPAPTITTLPEDFIHYERTRIPTVREIARIQSFPDTFEFKGPRTTGGQRRRNSVPQYTQVGNAVPPKFAEKIAQKVREYLESKVTTPGQGI